MSSHRNLKCKVLKYLEKGDRLGMVSVLRKEGLGHGTLSQLHQLVTTELSSARFSRVHLVVRALDNLSENDKDLQALLSSGLISKVTMMQLNPFLINDLVYSRVKVKLEDRAVVNVELEDRPVVMVELERVDEPATTAGVSPQYAAAAPATTWSALNRSTPAPASETPLLLLQKSLLIWWYEAVFEKLTCDLSQNAALRNLTAAFFDYFLELAKPFVPVSELRVILMYLSRTALDPTVAFRLRLEAIRTFNSSLESCSPEQRRVLQNHQDIQNILSAQSDKKCNSQELSSARFSRVHLVVRALDNLSENDKDLQALLSSGLISKVFKGEGEAGGPCSGERGAGGPASGCWWSWSGVDEPATTAGSESAIRCSGSSNYVERFKSLPPAPSI
ncbi:hypothetical protein WMY93_005464 [Mugilogobius chulae]|uniref:Uncharacterized protein n=1 Tax=Mugilogobius chulae TaxID=88201 RepID=A0AAW0PK33_9GOBI